MWAFLSLPNSEGVQVWPAAASSRAPQEGESARARVMLPAASSGGESANVESVGASQDTNPAVPDEVAAPAKPLRRPTSSFTPRRSEPRPSSRRPTRERSPRLPACACGSRTTTTTTTTMSATTANELGRSRLLQQARKAVDARAGVRQAGGVEPGGTQGAQGGERDRGRRLHGGHGAHEAAAGREASRFYDPPALHVSRVLGRPARALARLRRDQRAVPPGVRRGRKRRLAGLGVDHRRAVLHRHLSKLPD